LEAAWIETLHSPLRYDEENLPVLYPEGSSFVAPPLRGCMEWWRELFELSTESLKMKEFVHCVRTQLLHIVNRKYDYDPLEYVEATGLTQSVRGFLLPVLKDLAPPVSLFWIVSAARLIGRGRKDKTPFSNDGVAGQLWP
jgi:hypothetical protein